jgi:hypothetical protein
MTNQRTATPNPGEPKRITELVLTESRTMREQTADLVDVLDKVKALALLPDGIHATTNMVASYYGVPVPTIESVVEGNCEELESNGRRVLKGAELRDFAAPFGGAANLGLSPKARSVAVFSRRAILNVGQLLTGSDVARQVRTYLLDVEEIAAPEQRVEAVERAQLARARLEAWGVAKQFGLVNPSYIEGQVRTELARMSGEEPDIDPDDITITCDEYLTEAGVTSGQIRSARTRLGRAVAGLYRARYLKDPQKIQRPIDGVHRDVAVYTHRDLDLFDKAWAELSRHYNLQGRIDGGTR